MTATEIAPLVAALTTRAQRVAALANEAQDYAATGNHQAAIGAALALDADLEACLTLTRAVLLLGQVAPRREV